MTKRWNHLLIKRNEKIPPRCADPDYCNCRGITNVTNTLHMKFLKQLNPEFDAIEVEHLESVEISEKTSPEAILSIIGLVAPILIKVCEVWKLVPGKRKESRNLCLDKAIAALRVASIFSSIKFKK